MQNENKLSAAQYRKLSRLVYEESGIVLNDGKYSLLVARLSKQMRRMKLDSYSDYIDLVSKDSDEFVRFIDAVTTNHTFFFRENNHCEYLLKTLENRKPLKIWSAASSSGEEAFSIAVQLLANAFTFDIFASDVSDSMLNLGRRAIYPDDRVRQVPIPMLHRYFQRGKGQWTNYVRVKKEVQQRVRFEKFNLLSGSPGETFDIIFCRNVMIYFDTPTRQRVVDNLLTVLKPGGYLFVGLAESLSGLKHSLTTVVPSGYRK